MAVYQLIKQGGIEMIQTRLLRNGEEYVLADELGKWGILQRMPPKYYPFLDREEASLEWIYPPSLSSKRKAMLKLNEILDNKGVEI